MSGAVKVCDGTQEGLLSAGGGCGCRLYPRCSQQLATWERSRRGFHAPGLRCVCRPQLAPGGIFPAAVMPSDARHLTSLHQRHERPSFGAVCSLSLHVG